MNTVVQIAARRTGRTISTARKLDRLLAEEARALAVLAHVRALVDAATADFARERGLQFIRPERLRANVDAAIAEEEAKAGRNG